MKKKDFPQAGFSEFLFWLAALFVVVFINVSPQALKAANPAALLILLGALTVIVASRFIPRIESFKKRLLFAFSAVFVFLAAVALFLSGAYHLLTYSYLPFIIAFSMAMLVIADPASPVVMLVAICTFLLGEAFWSLQIGVEKKLIFPAAFLRIFSLTLVTIFSYHLYRRQAESQAELSRANKKLLELDRIKSDFVANVSHELRTPLTSIRNAILLLDKLQDGKKIDASAKELLGIINSNIKRQSNLIENLLDLSKIEKGKGALKRSMVDVGRVAGEVSGSIAIIARAKSISFSTDIAKGLPEVYAAEEQIAEVFINLLDNAIKYTEEGGRVSLKVEAAGSGIRCVVSDTGIGMKEEDLPKIFDKFERLGRILEHKRQGAGLGLAIVKEIIASHGGRIWAESRPGEGSRFIFTLPGGLRREDKK